MTVYTTIASDGPAPRVPLQTAEKVLQLYREKYFDFNVRHFHEKLTELLHRIRVPVRRYGHEVTLIAHVNPAGIGMNHRQTGIVASPGAAPDSYAASDSAPPGVIARK